MMRIALVAPLFESVPPKLYGGTERVVANLCEGLVRSGAEVTVFASADSTVNGALVPMVDRALRLRESPVQDIGPYHLRIIGEVAKRAAEFDVIHNHNDYSMFPLSKIVSTPVLSTLHGRLDLPDLRVAFDAFPELSFISISDSQRIPQPQLRWVKTIYHGIDVERFEFRPKPGEYLAFLGRIAREKRPEWAIEIAKKSGVPLKIAAKIEKGEGQDYYDTFIKPHVDGKFIEYVGEISESEKSDFLGNARALVFPIDWPEPFGLVVIEALACGTPVLARPVGSVPELLEDGKTGFLDLRIERLAERVLDLSQISRSVCRAQAEKRFSVRRMTEDYLNVYRFLSEFRPRVGRSDRHRRDLLYPLERSSDRNT
ncbi:glycosyltransferase family 4 protein [Bdellovibrionota bacterium FG-2]